MTKHPNQPTPHSRFNTVQRKALDAICMALKRRAIDFHTATELSDMVKAKQIDEVMTRLKELPKH